MVGSSHFNVGGPPLPIESSPWGSSPVARSSAQFAGCDESLVSWSPEGSPVRGDLRVRGGGSRRDFGGPGWLFESASHLPIPEHLRRGPSRTAQHRRSTPRTRGRNAFAAAYSLLRGDLFGQPRSAVFTIPTSPAPGAEEWAVATIVRTSIGHGAASASSSVDENLRPVDQACSIFHPPRSLTALLSVAHPTLSKARSPSWIIPRPSGPSGGVRPSRGCASRRPVRLSPPPACGPLSLVERLLARGPSAMRRPGRSASTPGNSSASRCATTVIPVRGDARPSRRRCASTPWTGPRRRDKTPDPQMRPSRFQALFKDPFMPTRRRGFTLIELAGGDRDHRRPHLPAAAGRPVGPRGGPACPVRQQPQAARPGTPQL